MLKSPESVATVCKVGSTEGGRLGNQLFVVFNVSTERDGDQVQKINKKFRTLRYSG